MLCDVCIQVNIIMHFCLLKVGLIAARRTGRIRGGKVVTKREVAK